MLRATNTTQPNPRNWKQNILKRNHMLPPWRPCSRSSLPTSTRPSPPSCYCLSSSPSFSFSPLLFSIVIELTFYPGSFHKHIWWWCLLYPLKKASPHSQHHNHHLQYTNEVIIISIIITHIILSLMLLPSSASLSECWSWIVTVAWLFQSLLMCDQRLLEGFPFMALSI